MDGYSWGYLHGLERGRIEGWEAADAHAAAVHANAYRIVQAHAKIDSHEEVEARVHQGPVHLNEPWPEPPDEATAQAAREGAAPRVTLPPQPVLREGEETR
jgi:hypothetical protein